MTAPDGNRRWAFALVWIGIVAMTAANWPRFRGPNGTGISRDAHLPAHWNVTDTLLWKVRVPGEGKSSPIIWGDRIFLQSSTKNGNERVLFCFDLANGKTLWSQSVPGQRARTHRQNTLASSTPATDGERVYALFWDGTDLRLHAYDLDGRPVWDRDLGPFVSQHGAGASPIVYDGKVFVANDQDGQSKVMAFDARTGDTVWTQQRRAFRACYSAPFVLERPGRPTSLIVASTAGITSYDPATGQVQWDWQWTFPRKPLRTVSSPIYSQGLIFANSGDGGGSRHTVAVRADGDRPRLVWQRSRSFSYVPTMLADGDYLYVVHDRGIAHCFVAQTGKAVWSKRLGNANVFASPLLVDGRILVIDESGQIFILRAAPRYELLGRTRLGEPVYATPAIANGKLVIRGEEHLFCIGVANRQAEAPPRDAAK